MVVILAILIGGGLITAGITQGGGISVPGVRPQTNNPEASALYMTNNEGVWFLIWTVFLTIGPLVTLAVVLAGFFWLTNRGIARAKQQPAERFEIFSLNPSNPRSTLGVLARRPALAIGLVLFLVVGLAVFLAAIGVFTPR